MNGEIQIIQSELRSIQERNAKVEAEKAWEISTFRIGCIAFVTYSVAALVLYVVSNDHPWRNALIPTVGFVLSTQSLPFLKNWWIKKQLKAKTIT